MCGIAGASWLEAPADVEAVAHRQCELLQHRGPDDSGWSWDDGRDSNLLLVHTRLSIIDLSASGHQPMVSDDGRFEIVFNGEIYNYIEIRSTLIDEGVAFHTQTDTEVLLKSWIHWGPECLTRFIGMFSFAINDRSQQTLTLVRDAFGIKPLFYRLTETQFSFSSELGALIELHSERLTLDWQRCYDYLVHASYDAGQSTFIAGVHSVRPAHFTVLDLKSRQLGPQQRWWSPCVDVDSTVTFEEAVTRLRGLLEESVRLHLRSDVPLGLALSGGIDSSGLACIAREVEPDTDLRTFSYVASGSPLDEEPWIDTVNEAIGARSRKVRRDAVSLRGEIGDLVATQGEPFGSTSIYAQYAVYEQVHRDGVVVTLDGQGADELFGGYVGFPAARMRSLLETGHPLQFLSFARKWSTWPGRRRGYLWKTFVAQFVPSPLQRLAMASVGRPLTPVWMRSRALKSRHVRQQRPQRRTSRSFRGRRLTEALIDSLERLPALLRHGDRNSMRFSVESRVPFLTIPIAEFAMSLPEEYLVQVDGRTKAVLREALRDLVPDSVLDRRDKIGFQTPEADWGADTMQRLDDWLPLLQPVDDVVDVSEVRRLFEEWNSGRRPYDPALWRIENFAWWLGWLRGKLVESSLSEGVR